MRQRLRDKKWFPYTLAACIAVTLYVALTHLPSVLKAAAMFIGFFSAPLLGCVLAYLMNPLAMFFHRTVFKGVKKDGLRWTASIGLTVLTLLLFLAVILSTLIPQLVESIAMLAGNLDGYIATLTQLAHTWGIAEYLNIEELVGTSQKSRSVRPASLSSPARSRQSIFTVYQSAAAKKKEKHIYR